MNTKQINIIVAIDSKNGIGKDNSIPWNFKDDMKYFKKVTTETSDVKKRNAIIMGRKTWESIGKHSLPNRINVVLTSYPQKYGEKINDILFYSDMNVAIENMMATEEVENIFIIGGSKLYKDTMEFCGYPHYCDKLYVTHIEGDYDCDVFFPEIDNKKYGILSKKKADNMTFTVYKNRKNRDHEEYQYLDMIENIMKNGYENMDRTKVGTLSLFGNMSRYSLKNNQIPMLTTKKVFLRGVIEEVLWFLRGDTDVKKLQEKNVHIWDGNSSREYLDSIGLNHYEEGDGGPIYGFNFRHFGAKYVNCHTDYKDEGVDQLAECINLIKNNENSRRILINLWNPSQLKEVSLPACHCMYQFYVRDNTLSCMMTQRSADFALGVPFNLVSASILTIILANICNLEPCELIHSVGNAHVYKNHIEGLSRQVKRCPKQFPKIVLNKKLETIEDIENLDSSDFVLSEYDPHPGIKMKMAV